MFQRHQTNVLDIRRYCISQSFGYLIITCLPDVTQILKMSPPPLWEEAISQVHLGWLSGPIPIDDSGRVRGFSLEGANFGFRFGVEQNEKLMACDDLRRNMVNLCTSVYTPITLPTWGHISEMAKRIRGSKMAWGFSKSRS